MLYNQPLATRFGTEFIAEIKNGQWDQLDVAVAWVRRSALDYLRAELTRYLRSGKSARFVVGVDLLNTSKEGLESLLALEAEGNCETYVFHNEANSVFHPKLYLFRKGNKGRLIVGSNNLTGAGLFQNTEVGLAIDGSCSKEPIRTARIALNAWMDVSSPLVRKLDTNLLADLELHGYVISEATLRARQKAQSALRNQTKVGKTRLFGTASVPKPSTHKQAAKSSSAAKRAKTSLPTATGQVLLLRPRLARGTQAQIPLKILNGGFFRGQLHARSIATGVDRPISFTFPLVNGKPSNHANTAKIELPEAATMANPLVRFVHTKAGIEFEVWDESSAQGSSVKSSLNAGLAASPPQTFLTQPWSPSSATWWRFI